MKLLKKIGSSLWTAAQWVFSRLQGKNGRRLFKLMLMFSKLTKTKADDKFLKGLLSLISHIDDSYKLLGEDASVEIAKSITKTSGGLWKNINLNYDIVGKEFEIKTPFISFTYDPKNGQLS